MNLLPQDVLVMVKLCLWESASWTYERLGHDLDMSASMAHSAVKRAAKARLFDPETRLPRRAALMEFLAHGVRYAYPPEKGALTRGIPTAHAAPVLWKEFFPEETEPYVWPHPRGQCRGVALSPLYRSVPEVAMRDGRLYQALALVDAIRMGRSGQRSVATDKLETLLKSAA